MLDLRSCSTFADTIRGRDPGFLFPLEEFGFVQDVQPLAAAFDDHGQSLLFVDLFDTLDVHWADAKEPTTECDPTQPRTSARWCSQDGAVTYEPLLADVLTNTDLFQTLHDTVPVIEATHGRSTATRPIRDGRVHVDEHADRRAGARAGRAR